MAAPPTPYPRTAFSNDAFTSMGDSPVNVPLMADQTNQPSKYEVRYAFQYSTAEYKEELARVERNLLWLTIASVVVAIIAIVAIIGVVVHSG